MGQKLVIGPINKGIRTDRTAFNIDNDSFPVLQNAYQWRGRVKRKRGTSFLGQLQRAIVGQPLIGMTDGSGNYTGNLFTALSIPESNPSIVQGSVQIHVNSDGTYIEPVPPDGTLSNGSGGTGTINYATGDVTLLNSGQNNSNVHVYALSYYPTLPVMGLEDLILEVNQFPGTLAFDTSYSYNINTNQPYAISDVSFYKNPPATASYTNYVQKSTDTATTWNGADYQQFWTVNYQGALWATNGIAITSGVFSTTNISMQFKPIVTVTITSNSGPAVVSLQITGHGLVVGDFLFINEVVTTTGINFQTGYVTTVTNSNNVVVTFPNATITTNGTGGIAQYLTNRSNTAKDCLRWYDGNPNTTNNGWVNFAPPLSNLSYSISNLPSAIYYLVGARMIVPFKDRLLFLGPVVQTSSGSPIYLQDTVIYSQNGTSYYTCSYTNAPSSTADTPTNPPEDPGPNGFTYQPILVPVNQTATPSAYFEDSTGFGGFIVAGYDQPIVTVGANEDVLIVGFNSFQTRLIASGNDIVPFNFFTVNSELGSSSTFSSITMDQGVISRGNRGFIITSQTQAQRIDIETPDQVFEISLLNNGTERVCSQRDFISEWIYFTYPSNEWSNKFPNQTLQYNYRDNSWGIFNECYTTYGLFRRRTGYTWATIGTVFATWGQWNEPWNSGSSTLLQQQVIAGNQQGFIVFREEGTNESPTLDIQSFSGSQITSPNHCLNDDDYITISGVLGTIGALVNGKVFSVQTITTNTFVLNPSISGSGTYLGGGVITRMYIPFIQTKQFPVAWDLGRKTRMGPQQYLFTTTAKSQITLLIFLSQNPISLNPFNNSAFNMGPIYPDPNSPNNSLVYSTVLYTCPESTNLGLTPANINLQMVTAAQQEAIWHRMNTSLIGDTVQIGFTMSDTQMRDPTLTNQFAEIEFHSAILDLNPSQMLA
jgi:hypothetical protein